MSAVAVPRQDDPWYRVVRCLVLLLVASLERKIARLIAAMEALPEGARFDAEFARLDDRCYGLECLRDHYLAWLEDPSVPLPRFRAAHHGVWTGWPVARSRVRRREGSRVAGARRRGRCRCALVRPLDRPAGLAGAAAGRARRSPGLRA